MNGWIKLHRKILDWEWYSDTNTFRLFMHLLLTATHKEISFRNKKIKAGSLITSLTKLSEETGLSKQEIRTALDKLKSTHEITLTATHRNSIITVENWILYQDNNTQSNTQSNTLATHSCYNKNVRKEEKREIIVEQQTSNNVVSLTSTLYKGYGSYSNVYLSKVQHGTLTQLMGGEEMLSVFIDELSENIASKKEQVFDESFPNMHFLRLRKYFKAHQSKRKEVTNEQPARKYNPYG